jgi:hypothetical protein
LFGPILVAQAEELVLKVLEAMPPMSFAEKGTEERELGMSSKKARRVTGLPS